MPNIAMPERLVGRAELCLVEIVADIPLRDTYGLKDGDVLAIELALGGAA